MGGRTEDVSDASCTDIVNYIHDEINAVDFPINAKE